MPEIEINANENIIWVGNAGFEAHADKVIVLQDDYRSGFECETCLDSNKHTIAGREVSTIRCEECAGSGRRLKVGNANVTVACTACEATGWIVCPDCGGKGGTLVLADNQKGKPTTGVIVSIGPEVKLFQRGQKVIYPSFSGNAYDLKGYDVKGRIVDVVLVILRDSDILSRMYGSLEQNQVKNAQARYTNA